MGSEFEVVVLWPDKLDCVEPQGGWFEGTAYPDGSVQDGKYAELAGGG